MSDSKLDVFVVGTRDTSPQGVARTAGALAPRLGLPPDKVAELLRSRFRVQTGLGTEAAKKLAQALEGLGARVAMQPAGASPSPPSAQASAAAPSPPSAQAAARPAPPPAPPRNTAKPTAPARKPTQPPQDDGGISIGALLGDGPQTILPASMQGASLEDLEIEPPPTRAPVPTQGSAKKAQPEPEDPFAPPEEGAESALDLAVPLEQVRVKKKSAAKTNPTAKTADLGVATVAAKPVRRVPITTTLRIAAVFAVALGLGFVPATLYASHVDSGRVRRLQVEMQDLTVNPWKGEEIQRSQTTVRREIEHVRMTATFLMMLIWTAAAGLLAALAFFVL